MGNAGAGRATPSAFLRSLAEARAGSSRALGDVLEASRNYLLLIASRQVQPDLRAKVSPSDLVQETCVEAQRHFERFQGATRQELLAWLRGILQHRLQKADRRYRAAAKRRLAREMPLNGLSSVITPQLRTTADAGFPGRDLVAEEDAAQLAKAIVRLPADHQQVIRLRNWELRSFAEIGHEMDRSSEAARSLWTRAVTRLMGELELSDARRNP